MRTSVAIVCFALLMCGSLAAAADITIAEEGQAKAVVVVTDDSTAPQRHAAEELAQFLGQITGAKFDVVSQFDSTKANLLIGPKAARLVDPGFSTDGLGSEGIVLQTTGNNLILAGGEPRGTLYAVYTFLEEQGGCRWWTPEASTILQRPTLRVDSLAVRFVPLVEEFVRG